MKLLLLVCGLCAAMVSSVVESRAQTAQEIVDQAAKVYAEARTYSVQASTREVTAIMLPSDTATPRYEVRSVRYRRLQVKLRRPDDWLIISQNSMGGGGSMSGGGDPSERAQVSILMKSGSGAPKQVFYSGSKQTTRNLPEEQFAGMVDSMLSGSGYSSRSEPDMVLKNFRSSAGSSGNIALGLVNPQIKDEASNAGSYCIVAQTTNGQSVTLWVEKTTSLIQRVVTQGARYTGGFSRPMPPGFMPQGPMQGSSSMVSLSETLYDQKINPPLAGGDFLAIPQGLDRMGGDQMGFGPVSDLVKLVPAPAPSLGNPGQPATAPTPAPPVTPLVVSEQQALSAEQMEGIVLIDGDEGTATGFMTQIKGVDFVVTNQHVLGENKTITLKNLHGDVVPVLAIFGAVGSDIAILRIAKGQGTLKLADDVLKSVKIGDKIVVVGNRLGGGVATQTSGQVLGVGPTRIEVNANFEPGNSGSPIFATSINEVVGVATYAETRRVAVEDGASTYGSASTATKVDKRWFGYRLDGITKWEQINMERWHAQGERIEKFRDMSEGLVAIIRLDFKTAAANERLGPLIADFESKVAKMGSNRVGVADEVKSLIYNVRNLAESGIRDFESAEYYDYYRTCLYWEESVPMQVEYRKAIVAVLKKYEANSGSYLSKMRNGGS